MDSVKETVRLYPEMTKLLAKDAFNLTKGLSNEPTMLSQIPVNNHFPRVKAGIGYPLEERALGVCWNLDRGGLFYTVGPMDKPLTRQELLSMLSSIYHQLGLASHFYTQSQVRYTIVVQNQAGWDDAIPHQQAEVSAMWVQDLDGMHCMLFPFRVQVQSGVVISKLHYFLDASEAVYGIMFYLPVAWLAGEV